MDKLFQVRAKVDINSKIKKGFMLTATTEWSKPVGQDIRKAVEAQYGREAGLFTDLMSKWEIIS